MEDTDQAPVEQPAPAGELRLASRGLRLGGSLLDAIIFSAIALPIYFAIGAWKVVVGAAKRHEALPHGSTLMWWAMGLAIFVLVQGYPLVRDGQTWGKKLVYTRIVTMDGGLPSVRQLCVRYAIVNCIGLVPYLGWFGILTDICLIFRKDTRCGHDLAAGTQVIDVFQKMDV